MNRLTYKLDEPIKTKYLYYDYIRIADYDISRGNFGRITDDKIYNKLGQLEDLEDKLEIDLITLFKALKDGIYYANDYSKRPRLYYSDDYKCWCFEIGLGAYVIKLKDYGKTWALTREELEDV